jgi:hypothetical protein
MISRSLDTGDRRGVSSIYVQAEAQVEPAVV